MLTIKLSNKNADVLGSMFNTLPYGMFKQDLELCAKDGCDGMEDIMNVLNIIEKKLGERKIKHDTNNK